MSSFEKWCVSPETALATQQVDRFELEAILTASDSRAWQYVLRHRFASIEQCAEAVSDPDDVGFACLCRDSAGRLAGWAAYFRFHTREHYTGTLQVVVESKPGRGSDAIYSSLLAACEYQAQQQGARNMIALVDGRTASVLSWFDKQSDFIQADALHPEPDATLHVFYKSIEAPSGLLQ